MMPTQTVECNFTILRWKIFDCQTDKNISVVNTFWSDSGADTPGVGLFRLDIYLKPFIHLSIENVRLMTSFGKHVSTDPRARGGKYLVLF